jgi:hypothetical protein
MARASVDDDVDPGQHAISRRSTLKRNRLLRTQ